jgi:hypothetical protein
MRHDPRLRASARAIYDACYLADELASASFDDAERAGTTRYRRAVQAALDAEREWSGGQVTQFALI